MLFVYFHFEKGKSTIYLFKQQNIENKSGREMLHKIIHRSERFWQEIVFVLVYLMYTKTIRKLSLRRFDKSEFFPHQNQHFYTFYLQKYVNKFVSPSMMFIDIKSSIIYRISCPVRSVHCKTSSHFEKVRVPTCNRGLSVFGREFSTNQIAGKAMFRLKF